MKNSLLLMVITSIIAFFTFIQNSMSTPHIHKEAESLKKTGHIREEEHLPEKLEIDTEIHMPETSTSSSVWTPSADISPTIN